MSIQITDMAALIAFWLVFTRLFAILIQYPLFEQVSVPPTVKVLATLVISFGFYPLVSTSVLNDVKLMGENSFWYLTFFHTVAGLVIGFFVKSIMMMFTSAGTIMTQQVGFQALNYFDPNAQQQIGPFEKIIEWTILLMILSSGALIPFFKGILISYDTVTIANWGKLSHSTEYFIQLFKSIFISGIMLATPMIFVNMVLNTVMGILSRSVPQMNILSVSFAVNIGVGLLVFAVGSEEFFNVAFKMYTQKLGEWYQFLQ